MPELEDDLALITRLAREGGAIAMRYFGEDPEVWMKEGQSPVSEADFAVDTFLKRELLAARPDYGWLSEETEDDASARLDAKRVFVVDPIDGTRGFLGGMSQWCVAVAVVEEGRPVSGVLECPVLKRTINAAANAGAHCNGDRISVRQTGDPLRVAGPRSLQTAVIDNWPTPVERLPFVPSLAYRLAMVAQGEIDLALARPGSKDWDLAAADLILHEAGGTLVGDDGQAARYNRPDSRHSGLVACSGAEAEEKLVFARSHMAKPHQKT